MLSTEILYLLPYLASLALCIGILLYAWLHRRIPGGTAYTWFVAGQTLSLVGFLFELTNSALDAKIFWDKFQWFTEAIILVSFPLFAIQFTETKLSHPKSFIALLFAFPVIFNLLVFTDPVHHLIYPDSHFTADYPFPDLNYTFTLPVYLYSIYVYTVTLGGIGFLLSRGFRSHRLFTLQTIVLAIGFFIPVIFSPLSLLNIQITPQRDATPFTFALGNLIIAWGLYRYHLFDVVPVGRETVFENLTDAVVVMDLQNRIVDINPATLAILNTPARQVIGQPAEQVFAEWQEVIARFRGKADLHDEISGLVNGVTRHYDMHVSLLRNRRGQAIGRAFTAIDITDRVELQNMLLKLNQELEERVQARTQDLIEAYDTTLEGWAQALELRDKETEGHTRRVTALTLQLAQAVGVSQPELTQIRRGALLHDIGKMALPDEILLKRGPLTLAEREIVNHHPDIAYKLLSPIRYLEPALAIPYCHHEKWDGTGYPRGLRGEQIPLAARIFAIADVWDAIQSDRPYNKAWSQERALEYMRAQSGIHFDPNLVQVFLTLRPLSE